MPFSLPDPAFPPDLFGGGYLYCGSDPKANRPVRELIADLTFTDPAGVAWHAPTGLKCDGASLPWILKLYGLSSWGGPKFPNHATAAILHDAYYRDHRGRTRYESDRMMGLALFELGKASGKDTSQRWMAAFYTAVRLFSLHRWGDLCFRPEKGGKRGTLALRMNRAVAKNAKKRAKNGTPPEPSRILDECDALLFALGPQIEDAFGRRYYVRVVENRE